VGDKGKAVETAAGYAQKGIPSGADLQRYIFEQMPYKNWSLWPGKGKFHRGTEPHGVYITVYANDIAMESINSAKGMANNSIVVKDNYNTEKQLTSVTVMKKVEGFNPEGGDWFWVRFSPDSKITNEGKVIMCLGCHTVAKDNDYIYTGKVTAKGPPAYSAPGYGEKAKKAAAGYGEKAKEGVAGYGDKAKEAVQGYGEKVPGYGKPGLKIPGK
jgi:hypothetical protein